MVIFLWNVDHFWNLFYWRVPKDTACVCLRQVSLHLSCFALLWTHVQIANISNNIIHMPGMFVGISGYVAANMYKKMGGESWVWNINLTSALFAGLYSVSLFLVLWTLLHLEF